MKIILASLGASLLMACGSEPGADATIYVDPPNDNSCIGVAGFEVIVSPNGRGPKTERRVGSAPILMARSCALLGNVRMEDLQIDTPVTVTITGYDGAGASRLSGTKALKSLRDGPVHLQLQTVQDPLFPVLVIFRTPILQGTPLSSVDSIVISTQKQAAGILTVERSMAGDYFNAEPGAYAIPDGLPEGGPDEMISVTFNAQGGRMIKEPRLIARWNGTYYQAMQP